MIGALHAGTELAIGVDHPAYQFKAAGVGDSTRRALLADLN